jgi:hypothetical protein
MRVGTCRVGAAGAALAAMLGCSDTLFGRGCTDEARPGLLVTVRDSTTGAPASDARVVARSGAMADTARFPLDGTYPLAYENAGTYEVTVEQTGYRAWRRVNVRVTRDECHVKTVSLTALLEPQP